MGGGRGGDEVGGGHRGEEIARRKVRAGRSFVFVRE